MGNFRGLRIPLFIFGLVLIFSAERYLSTYDYYGWIVAIGISFCLLPTMGSFGLYNQAKKKDWLAEAKSWKIATLWMLIIDLGIAVYYLSLWQIGGIVASESILARGLAVVWFSLIILGSFLGLGTELSLRNSGEGENAEPIRVVYGAKIWLTIGLLLLGLVGVNYAANKKDKIFDLSYFKSTKPGESTQKLVTGLTSPIKVVMFFSRDSEVLPFVREYLDTLARLNVNIKVESFDKDLYPAQAEQFRASRNGQIVFEKDGKRQHVDLGDKIEKARKKLRTLDSQVQKALLQLTSERGAIYFTANHGEMGWSIDRQASLRSLKNLETVLRSQNFSPRSLPNTFAAIPNDAEAVAIVGPVSGFAKEEVDTLRDYLKKGGKLLVALDVEAAGELAEEIPVANQNELENFLKEIGVEFHRDRLANDREYVRSTRQKFDHLFIYTNNFGSHESVSTLTRNDEKLNILALHSGYLTLKSATDAWKPVATIMTLKSTFIDLNKNFEYDRNEPRNAHILAAAAEKDLGEGKKSQVIVLADASMLSDPPLYYNGNQWMALDAFRWLTDRMNVAGTIETEEDVKIQHSKGRELLLFHGSIYAMPLIVLVLGFVANRRRRVRA